MDKNTSLDLTNITYELAKNSVEKTTENVQDSSTVVINLIINIMACPFTVLLNAMVIMAIKRRTRLQTNSNILLACLAATDALTGLITQPAFIFWNTFEMTGAINYVPARLTYSPGGGGGTLGISGWGCAAGTLEPLTYTRASSAEFCYPILE